jgi:hypothetical protein
MRRLRNQSLRADRCQRLRLGLDLTDRSMIAVIETWQLEI